MLSTLLELLNFLGRRDDDDFVDRSHYYVTSNILIALSVLVSFKQFGGKPIECMVPDMFPSTWEQYTENYCWAKDTFHLPFEDSTVPIDAQDRYRGQISYYQWVPFFLLIQAACFRLPSLIWKYMAANSGIKIHDIVKLGTDPNNVQAESRQQNIKSLTVYVQNALRFHRRLIKKRVMPHKQLKILNLPYTAFYVTFVYIFVKALYLTNVMIQLWLLNKFLETDKYSWYGFGALSDILRGRSWEQSGVFPRVTLCDFNVRVMGANVQRYTVQCVLVINIFNEKIFVFLFFWYTVLVLLTMGSVIYWLILMGIPNFSRWFISRHLELSEMPFDPAGSRKDIERFVAGYLKTDGVFVLRMITMHAGVIFGTDLILNLWRTFYGIEEEYRKSTPIQEKVDESKENKFNFMKLRRRRKSDEKPKKKKPSDKELMQVLLPDGTKSKAMILNPESQGEEEEEDEEDEEYQDETENESENEKNEKQRDAVRYQDEDERQWKSKSERNPRRQKNSEGMQRKSSEPKKSSSRGKKYSDTETLTKSEDV